MSVCIVCACAFGQHMYDYAAPNSHHHAYIRACMHISECIHSVCMYAYVCVCVCEGVRAVCVCVKYVVVFDDVHQYHSKHTNDL